MDSQQTCAHDEKNASRAAQGRQAAPAQQPDASAQAHRQHSQTNGRARALSSLASLVDVRSWSGARAHTLATKLFRCRRALCNNRTAAQERSTITTLSLSSNINSCYERLRRRRRQSNANRVSRQVSLAISHIHVSQEQLRSNRTSLLVIQGEYWPRCKCS